MMMSLYPVNRFFSFCVCLFILLDTRQVAVSRHPSKIFAQCKRMQHQMRNDMGMLERGEGRTDDPDLATGLTSRDKYLLTSSWVAVRKTPTENGGALLILFFEKHPDYQQLFHFKGVPLIELRDNKRFQAHSKRVIEALTCVIDSLENPELLVDILTKIGEMHFRRHVPKQAFLDLKNVMIELFSTFMKDNEITAWKKASDVVFSVVIKGLESQASKST